MYAGDLVREKYRIGFHTFLQLLRMVYSYNKNLRPAVEFNCIARVKASGIPSGSKSGAGPTP